MAAPWLKGKGVEAEVPGREVPTLSAQTRAGDGLAREPTNDREDFLALFLAYPIRGGGIKGSSVMPTSSRPY
jgi:hypothetical protein